MIGNSLMAMVSCSDAGNVVYTERGRCVKNVRKLKWTYICNLCGNIALPVDKIDNMGDLYKTYPSGWEERGKIHLCPDCLNVLRKCPHWRIECD